MIPALFPESNKTFGPPPDLEESQCHSVRAYVGMVERGSVEGVPIIVLAYKPTEQELIDLCEDKPIYLTLLATQLPPHYLSTHFYTATHPD